MTRIRHIIFLDEEGTGLSPYAEILLRKKLEDQGIGEIRVSSRGNVVLFPEPANQKITELARMKGLSLEDYRAAALEGTEFSENTLVLTFNADSKQKVYDSFPNAVNVYMIREYVGESGDIVLPLGGSIEDYNTVCSVVDRVTDRLLEKLS
ncbi:MAG: hypothetical protein IJ106_03960 [Parasporobacterium sp.]|nr:hypothetical protein [Parasporobacterium sp.]